VLGEAPGGIVSGRHVEQQHNIAKTEQARFSVIEVEYEDKDAYLIRWRRDVKPLLDIQM